MIFGHSAAIRADYPELVAAVLTVDGITPDVSVTARTETYWAIARQRLATGTESELPEIQAWRRTFAKMGLKPTQYRCASEALLRRFRKDGALLEIHPAIDLCNAVSLAFGVPIAVFDVEKIAGDLEVRYADGDETYLTFGGEIEHPEPKEVIYADSRRQAHARRWTNRQSGLSAVRPQTRGVLIVAEAMHDTAAEDVPRLEAALRQEFDYGLKRAMR